jgi:hypothetical protein
MAIEWQLASANLAVGYGSESESNVCGEKPAGNA